MLLFAVVLLLGQVLPENTYRRVLVPIIWQMCISSCSARRSILRLATWASSHWATWVCRRRRLHCCADLRLRSSARACSRHPKQPRPAHSGHSRLLSARCHLRRLLGLLVGIPALRLHGDYLAIVTLGFGLIVENVIANLPFAGGDGLASGTASSSLYANGLGLSTALQAKYVWFVLGITICALRSCACSSAQIRSRHRGHPRR